MQFYKTCINASAKQVNNFNKLSMSKMLLAVYGDISDT